MKYIFEKKNGKTITLELSSDQDAKEVARGISLASMGKVKFTGIDGVIHEIDANR